MFEVSIVIRSKNEEKYIGNVLDMIYKQSYQKFEIIVVDSGSTDKTIEIAKRYNARVFEIKPEDFTYGYALNYGFERAKGKYVVCLSAHAIPVNQGWLGALLSNLVEEKIAGVMGKEIPHPDCNPFEYASLIRKYKKYGSKKVEISQKNDLTFGNANCVLRKDIWERIHFNEELLFGEDYDWAEKVKDLGYRLTYEPEAVVYHSHNLSIKEVYRRFYNQANAERFIMNTRRNNLPDLLFNLIAGSIYDMFHVILEGFSIKWLPSAVIRRMAINYGRYKGYRQIDISTTFFEATLKRIWIKLFRKLNDFLSNKACLITKLTGKSPYLIHPKHLLKENRHHFWYLDFIDENDKVLDIGCGNGIHSISTAEKCKYVVGVDYDPKNIELANKMARGHEINNISFCLNDVEEGLAFTDKSFDKIMLLDILEHLNNDTSTLKECFSRILKNDGLLLVAVPNTETSWKKLQKRLGLFYYSDLNHKREYTLNEIKERLEENGFTIINLMSIVYDTPWYGVIDFIGAISLNLYARLFQWKRSKVIDSFEESIGFRIVAKKK